MLSGDSTPIGREFLKFNDRHEKNYIPCLLASRLFYLLLTKKSSKKRTKETAKRVRGGISKLPKNRFKMRSQTKTPEKEAKRATDKKSLQLPNEERWKAETAYL